MAPLLISIVGALSGLGAALIGTLGRDRDIARIGRQVELLASMQAVLGEDDAALKSMRAAIRITTSRHHKRFATLPDRRSDNLTAGFALGTAIAAAGLLVFARQFDLTFAAWFGGGVALYMWVTFLILFIRILRR